MNRGVERGMTLIEVMIVVLILGIMMALLIVLVPGIMGQSKIEKTKGIIKRLEQGIVIYKSHFNGFYPPQDAAFKSHVLHYYLGSKLKTPVGFHRDGTQNVIEKEPCLEFKADELKGMKLIVPTTMAEAVPVIDAWENEMTYKNPGIDHRPNGSNHAGYIDIESGGEDGDIATPDDNISNYIQ